MRRVSPVLLLLALIWSAPMLVFDAYMGSILFREARAFFHPSTQGTITVSDLLKEGSGKYSKYTFMVQYTYQVNGRPYIGSRYSHGEFFHTGQSLAQELRGRFPVGSRPPVFYNPDDPLDAVLIRGVQGPELLVLLFMAPFNMVMVWLWYLVLSRLRWRDEVGSFQRDGCVHVTLHESSGVSEGLRVTGICAFMSAFCMGACTSFNPPLLLVLAAWGGVLYLGVSSAHRHHRLVRLGLYDLILDEQERMLSLPSAMDRSRRIELEWSLVEGVSVEKQQSRDDKGRTSTYYRLMLMLKEEGGEGRARVPVVLWQDQDRVEALARWLRARLKLPEPRELRVLNARRGAGRA